MSYDVHIGNFSGNMTWNIGQLFRDHIPAMDENSESRGITALDGLTGKQAHELLSTAFNRMNQTRLELWQENVVGEPRFCRKYDAKNGWGSAVGGIIFLANIMAACAENPRKKVRVC